MLFSGRRGSAGNRTSSRSRRQRPRHEAMGWSQSSSTGTWHGITWVSGQFTSVRCPRCSSATSTKRSRSAIMRRKRGPTSRWARPTSRSQPCTTPMHGTFHAFARAKAKPPTGQRACTTTASGVQSPSQRCTADVRRRMLEAVNHAEAWLERPQYLGTSTSAPSKACFAGAFATPAKVERRDSWYCSILGRGFTTRTS